MRQRLLGFGLFLMMLAIFAACNDDEEKDPEITVTQATFTVTEEPGNIKVPFTVTPADYVVEKENIETEIIGDYHSSESGSNIGLAFPSLDIVSLTAGSEEGSYIAEINVAPNVEEGNEFKLTATLALRLDGMYDSNSFSVTVDIDKKDEEIPAEQ